MLTAEELVANLNISEDAFDFDTSNPQLQRHFEVGMLCRLLSIWGNCCDGSDPAWSCLALPPRTLGGAAATGAGSRGPGAG